MSRNSLTAERLRELFRYDPDTGKFTYLVANQKCKVGDVAGARAKSPVYNTVCVDGHQYSASRLAYLYMVGHWPEHHMDHRDLDPSNERWDNLRPATPSQNAYNRRGKYSDLPRPYFRPKGVTFKKGRYVASIRANGKAHYLGTYDSDIEASIAYETAAEVFHGEFARLS